ncbi:hypothetical protein KKE78_05405, partial [Patescibacteria group bacterium]|nr:hypothetical protein [Patescibacteria group bacterium]
GITRAKEKLFLTYAVQRLYFGTRSNNLVSRFLTDIPENLISSNTNYRDRDQSNTVSEAISSFDEDEDEWLNA